MSTSSSSPSLPLASDAEVQAGTGVPRAGLRRRTLVAGAAWAVPAVVIASPAAYAVASPDDIPSNSVCSIKYYEGDSARQSVEIGLSVKQVRGMIPAGTTFYWTVHGSGQTNVGDPVVSALPGWSTPVLTVRSKTSTTAEWEIAATTTVDMDATLELCAIFLTWRGTVRRQPGYINGGSRLNIQTYGTEYDGDVLDSHQFELAERRTDLAVDGYTEEELKLVSAHTFRAGSSADTPQVYWSPDGVTPSGPNGEYLPEDFVNAKFSWYNAGNPYSLPRGVDGDTAYSI